MPRSLCSVVINESVAYANVDGEAVLLDVDSGFYFGLNQVGTRIWELLSEGKSAQEIFSQMADEYDVDDERLHSELAAFMNALVGNGLATLAGE